MDLTVAKEETYYVVRSHHEVVIARCANWDDAVVVAERHCGSYIHSTECGANYYRNERKVVEYIA